MKKIYSALGALLLASFIFSSALGNVTLKGQDEAEFSASGGEWVLKTGDKSWKITGSADQWALKNAQGKVVAKAQGPKNDISLNAQNGKTYKLKCESETCRLYDADKLIFRIKEKKDKTNIYDGTDKRTHKVKDHADGFSIKSATGNVRTWKVKGLKEIKGAGLLASPLPIEERFLLLQSWLKQ